MAFPFSQLTKARRRANNDPKAAESSKPTRRKPNVLAARPRPDKEKRKSRPHKDRGGWRDLTGPRPRGLRRSRLLDRLGWYELDDEPAMWSTRQAIPTMPAIVGTAPPAFLGRPLGMDNQSGQLVASDPFELYRAGVIQSVNVLIAGDVGTGKSTLGKDHYVLGQLTAGRRVCAFDRKRQQGREQAEGAYGEYGRAATVAERSGLSVAKLSFTTDGSGARINLLDPAISTTGDQEAGVGQDLLLVMAAELAHGPLGPEERWVLSAAHRVALDRARSAGRVAILSDVVDALYTLTAAESAPHDRLIDAGIVDDATVLEWGMRLAMDLSRSDLLQLFDGETCAADGSPLDLTADLLLIDTSDLAEGSPQLVMLMAVMTSFVASVWAADARASVVLIEEGYSANLPTAGQVLRSLAKRGRGIGLAVVFIVHHLSDIPPDSPLRSLLKEVGIVHAFRQQTEEDASDLQRMFALPSTTEALMRLSKGVHILREGDGRRRPVRQVAHLQTRLDRWVTWTDDNLDAAAPTNPFEQAEPDSTGLARPE